MATLLASPGAVKYIRFAVGAQALPDQSAFLPSAGSEPSFKQGAGQIIPALVIATEYIDPDLSVWNYSFSNSGFLEYTGTVSVPGVDIFVGISPVNTEINGSGFIACATATPFGLPGHNYLISEAGIGVNDGVVAGAPMLIADGDIIDPYFPVGATNVSGLFDFGNNLWGVSISTVNPGDDHTLCVCVDGGGGAIDQLKIYEYNAVAEFSVALISTYIAGRYRTIFQSTVNGIYLLDFLPVALADPVDAIADNLALLDPGLQTLFASGEWSGFTDGTDFYFVFTTVSGSPILPFALKVDNAWTRYNVIHFSTDDPQVQSLIDESAAGGNPLSLAWSADDGQFMLTGGSEPIIYGVGVYVTTRVVPIPVPIKLPCYVSCFPVIDKRVKK